MSTDDLQLELQKINSMLQTMNDEEKAHKEAFGNLYKQLESYKSDFAQKLKTQLLREMLTYFDSLIWYQGMITEQLPKSQSQILSKDTESDTDNSENSQIDILENTQYLVEEFLEMLRRNDVVVMPDATHFDGKFHRAVQVLESHEKDDEGKIAKITRKGFYLGSQIVRVEEVVVYRYVAQPEEESLTKLVPDESEQEDSEQEDSEQEDSEQETLNIQLPTPEE
jgi:molecular chaperone GrpE (heat shock protein)